MLARFAAVRFATRIVRCRDSSSSTRAPSAFATAVASRHTASRTPRRPLSRTMRPFGTSASAAIGLIEAFTTSLDHNSVRMSLVTLATIPTSARRSRKRTRTDSLTRLQAPIIVSPTPACRISPGPTNVTPCAVVPATTRRAVLAIVSAFPRPFGSVTKIARSANARNAIIAFEVSYDFVVTKMKSGFASCGTGIAACGFAMIDVFPEMRKQWDLTAEMCSALPMSVTSCRWERRPPKKLPIAPAPNTRISTTRLMRALPARRSPRVPADPTLEFDRHRSRGRMASLRHTTHQWALRHTDRREVESDADITRDAEERRMQTAVSVNQQDVRLLLQATDGRFNSWEFAICQVRRDVGKLSRTLHGGDFGEPEILRVEGDRNDVHRSSVVAGIDSADTLNVQAAVLLDYSVG